jgi:hypothetical protein
MGGDLAARLALTDLVLAYNRIADQSEALAAADAWPYPPCSVAAAQSLGIDAEVLHRIGESIATAVDVLARALGVDLERDVLAMFHEGEEAANGT